MKSSSKYTLSYLLIPLICIISLVSAVFVDEAGVIDWHQSNLGLLSSSPAPSIYYSHYHHVLASLNSANGTIAWRKLLSTPSSSPSSLDNDPLPVFYNDDDAHIIIGFSSSSLIDNDVHHFCKLSIFNSKSASQLWELTVSGSCLGFAPKSSSVISVLTSSTYYTVDFDSGSILNSYRPELLHSPFEFVALSKSGIVLEDTSAGSILEYKFSSSDDDEESDDETDSQSDSEISNDPFESSPIIYGPGKLLAYSHGLLVWSDDSTDDTPDTTNSIHVGSSSTVLADVSVSKNAQISVINSKTILLHQDSTIYAFDSKSGAQLYKLENIDLFAPSSSALFPSSFTVSSGNTITIISARSGSSIYVRATTSIPSLISGEFVQYPNGVVEPVALGQSENSYNWTRDESLAHLTAAVVIDYPDDEHTSLDLIEARLEENLTWYLAYIRRLTRHTFDFIHFIKSSTANFPKTNIFSLANLLGPKSKTEQEAADIYFGLKKYFIAISKTGRVQALDSTNHGTPVWIEDLYTPEIASAGILATNVDQIIFLVDSTGKVNSLSGLTGEALYTSQIPLSGGEKLLRIIDLYLPHGYLQKKQENEEIHDDISNDDNDNSESESESIKLQVPVIWTSENRLYNLDGSLFIPAQSIYVSKTSDDKSKVIGYLVSPEDGKLHQTWLYNAPTGHVIHDVKSRSPLDHTINVGHVLSDRSVLYKYLHPNMLAITSTAPGSLVVSLVDSVTGRILHSKKHEVGTGPATDHKYTHLVFGEHWIVYTYWATKPTIGQIIVVWDLYESEFSNKRELKTEYSSFEYYEPPHVKSQAYFAPTQYSKITSMGLTRTRFGIAVRDVVIATERNQIISLPKRPSYLDARRPVDRDATSAEAGEEGLVKYDSILGYNPQRQTISHTQQVLGIETILSVPAVLESTSLIACYGLDLFFTRLAPSHQFDILAPSFAKEKLIYTLIAMSALVLYLKPWVDKRKTNTIWGI